MRGDKADYVAIALIGILLLVVGCDAKTVSVALQPDKATYSRDVRTNLCFAAFGRANGWSLIGTAESFSVTAVPCTSDVLARVPPNQR